MDYVNHFNDVEVVFYVNMLGPKLEITICGWVISHAP